MPEIHAVLIADSRAFNFDKYRSPSVDLPYKSHYIVERGGTTQSLQILTREYLQSGIIPKDANVIVKIAAGINNTTRWIPINDTFTLGHMEKNKVLEGLKQRRRTIKGIFPNAIISFITVPPVDLIKYRIHRQVGFQSHTDFNIAAKEQTSHINFIQELNKTLIDLNRSQAHLTYPPYTSCCQSDVIKCAKNKKRNQTYKRKNKVKSERLYDGVHGVSQVKKVWFYKWHLSVLKDVQTCFN